MRNVAVENCRNVENVENPKTKMKNSVGNQLCINKFLNDCLTK